MSHPAPIFFSPQNKNTQICPLLQAIRLNNSEVCLHKNQDKNRGTEKWQPLFITPAQYLSWTFHINFYTLKTNPYISQTGINIVSIFISFFVHFFVSIYLPKAYKNGPTIYSHKCFFSLFLFIYFFHILHPLTYYERVFPPFFSLKVCVVLCRFFFYQMYLFKG